MSEYGTKREIISKDHLVEMMLILIIVSFVGTVGNFIGYGVPIQESIPGILIILAVAFAGQLIAEIIPLKVSYILYVTIIGMYLTCKWCPIAPTVNEYVGKINMLALSTVCLAFAGAGMAKDWVEFKKIGLKGIVVALFAMFGTFVGSAVIAQAVLKFQGII